MYGDGWDQGVERTRGGIGPPDKRATVMFEPERSADLEPKEKSYLSRLDRSVLSAPKARRADSEQVWVRRRTIARSV